MPLINPVSGERKIFALRWSIILTYLFIPFVFIVAILMKYIGYPIQLLPIFVIGVVQAGIALLHHFLIYTKNKWLIEFAADYFYTFVMIFFITALVHYSGGVVSPFIWIYLLPIAIDGILYSFEKGIYAVVFSVVAFVTLMLMEYFVFYFLRDILGLNLYRFFSVVFSYLVGYFLLFWVVGVLVAILGSRLRKEREEAEKAYVKLEKTYGELAELDKAKTDFVSMVSHELKAPLTSIKAFTQTLLLRPDLESKRKAEFLNIIDSETDRLTRLINNILNLTRIETGTLEWHDEPLRIASLIETTVRAVAALAESRKINLELKLEERLPELSLDRDRFLEVMNNLLNNAIKYTPEGGRVIVRAQKIGDGIQISVSDTGRGIAREDLEKVFEKFAKVTDVETGEIKTAGLGLSISKGIIEHYRGRIWVESEVGKGSTFYFITPVSRR